MSRDRLETVMHVCCEQRKQPERRIKKQLDEMKPPSDDVFLLLLLLCDACPSDYCPSLGLFAVIVWQTEMSPDPEV